MLAMPQQPQIPAGRKENTFDKARHLTDRSNTLSKDSVPCDGEDEQWASVVRTLVAALNAAMPPSDAPSTQSALAVSLSSSGSRASSNSSGFDEGVVCMETTDDDPNSNGSHKRALVDEDAMAENASPAKVARTSHETTHPSALVRSSSVSSDSSLNNALSSWRLHSASASNDVSRPIRRPHSVLRRSAQNDITTALSSWSMQQGDAATLNQINQFCSIYVTSEVTFSRIQMEDVLRHRIWSQVLRHDRTHAFTRLLRSRLVHSLVVYLSNVSSVSFY